MGSCCGLGGVIKLFDFVIDGAGASCSLVGTAPT